MKVVLRSDVDGLGKRGQRYPGRYVMTDGLAITSVTISAGRSAPVPKR